MFHGIPELRKDSSGYVYWRDIHVEHYSHQEEEKERQSAHRIAARCRHLEKIGVQVSVVSAAWRWEWWEDMEAGNPYIPLLSKHPEFYEHEDREQFVITTQFKAAHWGGISWTIYDRHITEDCPEDQWSYTHWRQGYDGIQNADGECLDKRGYMCAPWREDVNSNGFFGNMDTVQILSLLEQWQVPVDILNLEIITYSGEPG